MCSGLQSKGQCLGLLAGLGDALSLQLPASHSKAQSLTLPFIPHPILSETQQDSNKTSVNNHLPRQTGSVSCGALCGSSRSKNPPQDWASIHQFPQPGRGTAFVKQVRAINNAIIYFQLAPQHLLLSFFSFLASLTVLWARPRFTLQPVPKVLPGLEESLSLHLYCAPVLTFVSYCGFLRL